MSKKSEIWENKDDTIGIFSYECGSICIDSVACGGYEMIDMDREEAIAAARAILKHFDVDFNAYEENISDSYRAPTEEELAKFLAENPNYKPIPKEAYDPNASLTSEIKYDFGEE